MVNVGVNCQSNKMGYIHSIASLLYFRFLDGGIKVLCSCLSWGGEFYSRCCLEDEGSHCSQCVCVFGGEGWCTAVGR